MSTAPTPAHPSNPLPLSGRRAVVTGATSGIGEATARLLAERGAQVAAVGRRREQLDALARESERIEPVQADVTDPVSLQAAAERLGHIDLLVICAGALVPDVRMPTLGAWRPMVEVNVVGALNTYDAFGPGLVDAVRNVGVGDLVTVSSIAAYKRMADLTVYSATKAALSALADGWRLGLLPTGVRVTDVQPGLVETELLTHGADMVQREYLGRLARSIEPLRPAHVADVIAYVVGLPPSCTIPRLAVTPAHQE